MTEEIDMELTLLIQRCKNKERAAQNHLYEQYAPVLLSIALRYMKHMDQAEDALVKAFYKILDGIDKYSDKGSFEGWMKRIVVNECLMALRKKKSMAMTLPVDEAENQVPDEQQHDPLVYEELLALLDELPVGYRTVFNLYAIEGYKHREIADMLGISINTSKSQLILARRKLQALLKKKVNYKSA